MAYQEPHNPYPSYQTEPPRDQFNPIPLDRSPNPSHHGDIPYGYGQQPSYGGGDYPSRASGYGVADVPGTPSAPEDSRRRRSYHDRGRFARFFLAYNTRNQLAFLGLIILQSAVVLTMIGLIYGTINDAIGDLSFSESFAQAPKLEPIATYMSLFILAVLFEFLVSLDALQEKNILSLCLLLVFQCAMVIYSSLLPSQLATAIRGTNADTDIVDEHVRNYSIVIPSVIGGFTIAMAWLIWRLYEEFGWNLYKVLGADLKIKRMYLKFQIFLSILKFDSFLFLGFTIQMLVLVSGIPTAELAITIAALPIIMVCLVIGAIFVRRESRAGTWIFLALQCVGIAYFLFKLVRIYDDSSAARYASARKTLTLFGVISLIFLLLTIVATGICMMNFDQGLRERIPGYRFNSTPRKETNGEKLDGKTGEPLAHHDTRMSLD
ncbi:hypothetical protein BCR35DRAFT_309283 [Leucosporidium creatinivorum]|uniref:DUF7789 domain-containing protein n=1 Tax=Leucosporidium creatinivorum TaxID=106004 RepID=A0A1Y2DJM1_9BASI|nr:hypothetical protein BCR35DRAFT_309283 [Leucosporidium creatinivorum]